MDRIGGRPLAPFVARPLRQASTLEGLLTTLRILGLFPVRREGGERVLARRRGRRSPGSLPLAVPSGLIVEVGQPRLRVYPLILHRTAK